MSKPPNSTTAQRSRLQQFRQVIYEQVFTRARDALFEALDALLVQPGVTSFAALCLAGVFRRQWPSLYAAIRDGRWDREALERRLTAQVPATAVAVYALDTTLWPHPQAKTLAGRQLYPIHGSGREIVAGHAYSLLSWVAERGTSWALPLSTRRVEPAQTAVGVGVEQVKRLCEEREKLGPGHQTVIAADGSYGNHRFLSPLKKEPCVIVARLRRDRVLYRHPEPYGGRGRPAKHGQRFAFKEPTTWGEPDEIAQVQDAHWGAVRLRRWNGLHAREDADTPFDVVQIESHRERERPPAPLWVACLGGKEASAEEIWRWYDHRWPMEPSIGFRKQRLHWTLPRFETEERCDRWTELVTLAQWELYLARECVADRPLPWQAAQSRKTPGRVQAGLAVILLGIGSPAAAPQTRGKSPGWPPGRLRQRPERHPVVRKSPKRGAKKSRKGAPAARAA
jgi:DDE superfamily endonuclease